MQYVLTYLLLVNGLGACAVALDKGRAKRGAWRIPEKTLFGFCLLGGCPGVYGMMRLARHKTRHRRFMWGIPLIFTGQMLLLAAGWFFGTQGGMNF